MSVPRLTSILVFAVGGRLCGLPAAAVVRVVRAAAWQPVAESGIRGLVDVAGAVVPVVDLSVRLGETPVPLRASQRFVLYHHRRVWALLADEVLGVRAVNEQLVPLSPPVRGAATADGVFLVYDVEALVSPREEASLPPEKP